jgi:hypothetical protein
MVGSFTRAVTIDCEAFFYGLNMDSGWIKIHRKIKDHWVFQNAEYFKAWIIMILEANHKNQKIIIQKELIECKRGQSINSIKTWTKLFGKKWSDQKVKTFFNLLRKDHMISQEGLKYSTRITILKYNSYQDSQLTDNELITNSQLTDNYKQEYIKNVKKGNNIEERALNFKNQVFNFNNYPKDMLELFCEYWIEPNKSKSKMRFELEKTWDLSRRLKTWKRNEEKWSKKNVKQTRTAEEIIGSAEQRAARLREYSNAQEKE